LYPFSDTVELGCDLLVVAKNITSILLSTETGSTTGAIIVSQTTAAVTAKDYLNRCYSLLLMLEYCKY
jgi:hypothetical protein